MPIYRPSELHTFLNELGIHPKKRLSQNFLIDGNIIRKIVEVSDIHSDDTILEIGPGPGSLTQALLETGSQVLAVEKDILLAQSLARLQTTPPKLSVYCEDVLNFTFDEKIKPYLKNGQKAKVVANLPYHLTTPIIVKLVTMPKLFSSLTIMVQEEVGHRFTALPGTSDYSSFTLFLRFYTTPIYAFTVSRHCFYPSPKVNSAVLVLKLCEPPLKGEDITTFFQLTRTAFEHRRKMLRSSLKIFFSSQIIENALLEIGQNPLTRPEMLSLEHFLKLHAVLYKKNS